MQNERIIAPYQKNSEEYQKYLEKKIKSLRSCYIGKVESASEISDVCFRKIVLFSILESLAQDYYGYSRKRGARKSFVDFVAKYQNYCDYLDSIDPITLYYDYLPKIKHTESSIRLNKRDKRYRLIPEINLEAFKLRDSTCVDEIIDSPAAKKLIRIVSRDEKEVSKILKPHEFIELLYTMRCKLVHEASSLGNETRDEEEYSAPFYRETIRLYIKGGNIVSSKVWELVIPYTFIRELTLNVVNNYYDDCLKSKRLPFKVKTRFKRDVFLSWHDKVQDSRR